LIYIIGHGYKDGGIHNQATGEKLTPAKLDECLDKIKACANEPCDTTSKSCHVSIIIDSCFSGNFLGPLSQEGRNVHTSSDSQNPMYGWRNGKSWYGQGFNDALGGGGDQNADGNVDPGEAHNAGGANIDKQKKSAPDATPGKPQESKGECPCDCPTTNIPPIALCGDVTVPADAVVCLAMVSPAQVDNGSSDPDGVIVERTLSPPGPYQLGDTTVMLTVIDDDGASATCMATITVQDMTPPQITCPPDMMAQADPRTGQANVMVGAPMVQDNCPGTLNVTAQRSDMRPIPDPFQIGTTQILWQVTDGSGNTNQCVQIIVVVPPMSRPTQ
jgi:hypothetical protein